MSPARSPATSSARASVEPSPGLETPLQYLKGVGPQRAKLLAKLGLHTVQDALFHLPARHEDRTELIPFRSMTPGDGRTATGTVAGVSPPPRGRPRVPLQVLLKDGTGFLKAAWFNQPYLERVFERGQRLIVHGKVQRYGSGPLQMQVKDYEIVDEGPDESLHAGRLVPVYGLTRGLTQRPMRIRVAGKDYDLRVSIMPTVHGEKVVLRVLDKANLSASIDKLGLDPDTLQQFASAVDAPHGLILVTGPTGSGKTTTLYSALNELNNPIYNIVTVEDPVEFQVPGINQVPTKKEIGLTFANALRSILRQDPDIIMIGEIRDTETAEIAVEAALTGHQVLSTMHCNDAPGAIARLDDMGIAPFLISSSVILACAQRLMRRICSHCKEPVTYPAKMYQDLNIDPSIFDGVTLYRGRGCDRCKNSGYAGRMAIIEAMTVTDEIRKLIIARANTRELGKIAIGQGMRTLRMIALDRAREGVSTLEQVLVLTSSH